MRAVLLVSLTKVENLARQESLETGERVLHPGNLVNPGILRSPVNRGIWRSLENPGIRK